MRVYVIGSEGQIARSLLEIRQPEPGRGNPQQLTPRYRSFAFESVDLALNEFRPDIVVNPAAYTAVDKAETESDLAFSVNRDGAATVALAARRLNIPIIHLSTDYVFDGEKASPYVETDPVGPRTVYGRSKLAGEVAVAAANERNIILRTSWVYAPFGSNFVRTIMRLGSERDRLRVVDDQIGCPTYAPDIARAIVDIVRTVKSSGWHNRFAGITHLAGPDRTTWFAFARQIMELVEAKGARSAAVDPITTADYPTAATRPANSCLNCDRLHSVFGIRLPALSLSAEACLARLLDGPH